MVKGAQPQRFTRNSAISEPKDAVNPGVDDDDTPIKAIAITGVSIANGTLEFATNDDGSNFTAVPADLSNTSALLLDDTDKLRFVPDLNFYGTAGTFDFRAWDQTTNAAGNAGNRVNTSTNGGTTEFSSATDATTVTVTAVNDAPVLTAAGSSNLSASGSNFTADNAFTTILEDATTINGDAVSTFLNSAAASDVETVGAVTGIAITSTDSANGDWEFSTNGSTFTTFTATASSSRLLDGANANHKVRFVPDANFNGTANITFRAWDKSAGAAGSTANTGSTGDPTPFSTGVVT